MVNRIPLGKSQYVAFSQRSLVLASGVLKPKAAAFAEAQKLNEEHPEEEFAVARIMVLPLPKKHELVWVDVLEDTWAIYMCSCGFQGDATTKHKASEYELSEKAKKNWRTHAYRARKDGR